MALDLASFDRDSANSQEKPFPPCYPPSKLTRFFTSALDAPVHSLNRSLLNRDLWATEPPPRARQFASKSTHSNNQISSTNNSSMSAHEQHGPHMNGCEESRSLHQEAEEQGDRGE